MYKLVYSMTCVTSVYTPLCKHFSTDILSHEFTCALHLFTLFYCNNNQLLIDLPKPTIISLYY